MMSAMDARDHVLSSPPILLLSGEGKFVAGALLRTGTH